MRIACLNVFRLNVFAPMLMLISMVSGLLVSSTAEAQVRGRAGCDEDVDVRVGSEVAPDGGAKQGDPREPIAPRETSQARLADVREIGMDGPSRWQGNVAVAAAVGKCPVDRACQDCHLLRAPTKRSIRQQSMSHVRLVQHLEAGSGLHVTEHREHRS